MLSFIFLQMHDEERKDHNVCNSKYKQINIINNFFNFKIIKSSF